MILENLKTKKPKPFFGHPTVYRGLPEEPEWCSEATRSMGKPGYQSPEYFRDRAPHTIPTREPEPRARPRGTSLRLRDEAPDAPLWSIIDRITGHVMARVRGSLSYIIFQCKLVAAHHGSDFSDLFYTRTEV